MFPSYYRRIIIIQFYLNSSLHSDRIQIYEKIWKKKQQQQPVPLNAAMNYGKSAHHVYVYVCMSVCVCVYAYVVRGRGKYVIVSFSISTQ